MSNLIWVEEFRPRNIDQCIMPERIKSNFRKMVETNNIQNYAVIGNAGSGKTSSARALCEQLNLDYIIINMSNESGIDTVRNKIVNFASTISFSSDYKVIIMDEFDHATKNAQASLRGIIEEYAVNCRFIITANYENKIIEPMFSRCPIIDFTFTNEERQEMLIQFIRRVEQILTQQNIIYDRKDLAKFCKSNFPDFRKTLNLLQMNSKDGELKFNSLGANSSEKVKEIISYLADHDFNKCREWTANNVQSNDGHLIRRAIYENLKEYIKDDSIPNTVLLINQYDYKEAHVVDKEINMVAFFVELMLNVEFKS